VAAWLKAINVAKARIARLIITMRRERNDGAISNASGSAVQSMMERAVTNSRQTVHKLSTRRHQCANQFVQKFIQTSATF
jgi:hypothetical protein